MLRGFYTAASGMLTQQRRALTGDSRNRAAVRQGSLESSNVDLSKEMTDLINVQRSYQFQSRAVTMADQMSGLVNGIR